MPEKKLSHYQLAVTRNTLKKLRRMMREAKIKGDTLNGITKTIEVVEFFLSK